MKKLTEKECLEMGGHCWETLPEVLMSNPPQYQRRCKHCGKTQIGHARESFEWRD